MFKITQLLQNTHSQTVINIELKKKEENINPGFETSKFSALRSKTQSSINGIIVKYSLKIRFLLS